MTDSSSVSIRCPREWTALISEEIPSDEFSASAFAWHRVHRRCLGTQLLHDQGKICLNFRSPAHDRSISGKKAAGLLRPSPGYRVVPPRLLLVSPRSRAVLARNRTDGRDQHSCRPGQPESEKIFDCRGAGKCYHIRTLRHQSRSRFRSIIRFCDCSIGKSNIHNGAQGFEPLR